MGKIREALELGKDYATQVLQGHDLKYGRHPATEAERSEIVADVTCFNQALALLSAPVTSDARELAYTIWQTVTQGSGTYWTAREPEAAALIDRYAAERERKAREEEREACAERAVAWQKKLCEDDDWPCRTCTECDQLRAAIKEAGNGK